MAFLFWLTAGNRTHPKLLQSLDFFQSYLHLVHFGCSNFAQAKYVFNDNWEWGRDDAPFPLVGRGNY